MGREGGREATRDAYGLLSGHTLIALASDLVAWLGPLWCGVVCCDGSSVEISITQANDKWTCCRKFSRLLSGRPEHPLWRHTASRPLSVCCCMCVCVWGGACHSLTCAKSAVWGKKLAQLGADMQSLLRLNMERVEAAAGLEVERVFIAICRQSCRDFAALARSSFWPPVHGCQVTLAFA